MPLLGQAAMLLTFDIVEEMIAEHDDWHTHEHLPERLSIPGFLRGTRWVATGGAPRYLVLYEVERLDTLASAAYRERLDNPTPWTTRMMLHYRGMSRGFCSVARSHGLGLGHFGLLIRFKPASNKESSLEEWLGREIMPQLPVRRGLGSVHLLKSALTPEMTSEQRIRGTDSGVDWAFLATGYVQSSVADLSRAELSEAALAKHGATAIVSTTYQAAYTLTEREANA